MTATTDCSQSITLIGTSPPTAAVILPRRHPIGQSALSNLFRSDKLNCANLNRQHGKVKGQTDAETGVAGEERKATRQGGQEDV
jgi:hypothetical protein